MDIRARKGLWAYSVDQTFDWGYYFEFEYDRA